MLRRLLFFWLALNAWEVVAQTGIGTTTPHASAKLDVTASNKGFLPPRVNLTDAFDQTTIPSPATGLLVYCNGGAGLNAGFYYWNGTNWATIATAGGSGSVAAEFGEQILSANVSIPNSTPTNILSFTIPSAGTWEIISFLRAQGLAGYAAEYAIYDPSGNKVDNSEILSAYGENASTGTGVVRITTTGSGIYTLKAWASSGTFTVTSDFNGRSGVTWKKISGNAPINAQKASGYVNAGTFVMLDNVKVTIPSSGNKGASIGAVSTSFTANIAGNFAYWNGGSGGNSAYNISYTSTAAGSAFGWGFSNAGDIATYILNDTSNSRVYRIITMIGPGYNNNFISIERLY
jgi:hypothetical protein